MEKLKDYITPDYLTNIDVFEKCLEDESSFKPFGNQLDQFILSKICDYKFKHLLIYFFFNLIDFDGEEKKFEVYVTEDENSAFKEYFNQLQTFVLWYIDSSNFIDYDDSKWKIFIM
jgi:hypothetical protein